MQQNKFILILILLILSLFFLIQDKNIFVQASNNLNLTDDSDCLIDCEYGIPYDPKDEYYQTNNSDSQNDYHQTNQSDSQDEEYGIPYDPKDEYYQTNKNTLNKSPSPFLILLIIISIFLLIMLFRALLLYLIKKS